MRLFLKANIFFNHIYPFLYKKSNFRETYFFTSRKTMTLFLLRGNSELPLQERARVCKNVATSMHPQPNGREVAGTSKPVSHGIEAAGSWGPGLPLRTHDVKYSTPMQRETTNFNISVNNLIFFHKAYLFPIKTTNRFF